MFSKFIHTVSNSRDRSSMNRCQLAEMLNEIGRTDRTPASIANLTKYGEEQDQTFGLMDCKETGFVQGSVENWRGGP